jgi:hypothetical protein
MRSRGILVLSAVFVVGQAGFGYAQSAALSAADAALAWAPSLTVMAQRPPAHNLRVVGAQDTVSRSLFGKSDLIVISGGTKNGVQLDQQYAVRRAFVFGHMTTGQLQTIHTAGQLRVVAVNESTAIAQVDSICDGIQTGDYLDPYMPPPPPPSGEGDNTVATLDFTSMRRVLFADEERRIASAGDFVMIERRDGQLAAGTRVAVYRDLQTRGVPLAAVGEGVIVSTGDAQLLRVISSRDAIRSGDYVVPHK